MQTKNVALTTDLGTVTLALAEQQGGIGCRDFVVLIHGLGCSKEFFAEVFRRSEFRGLTLVAVDLLGFGDSERPAAFSYAMEDQARILETLLDRYPACRLHIMAHSMGGAVGLLFSKSLFERVGSFVSIEGNLISEDCDLLSRRAVRRSFDRFESGFLSRLRKTFQGDDLLRSALDKASPVAFYQSSASLVAWSDSGRLLDRFKGLGCAKHYVYGEQSHPARVLERLEGIEAHGIEKSGHFVMRDNPEAFYSRLSRIIESSST